MGRACEYRSQNRLVPSSVGYDLRRYYSHFTLPHLTSKLRYLLPSSLLRYRTTSTDAHLTSRTLLPPFSRTCRSLSYWRCLFSESRLPLAICRPEARSTLEQELSSKSPQSCRITSRPPLRSLFFDHAPLSRSCTSSHAQVNMGTMDGMEAHMLMVGEW